MDVDGCAAFKVAHEKILVTRNTMWLGTIPTPIDERQITHLICARLKYDLYDFFRGCFGPASFLFLV